jgi:hypothetical protein
VSSSRPTAPQATTAKKQRQREKSKKVKLDVRLKDLEPAKTPRGGDLYDYPGEYAQRFDGVDSQVKFKAKWLTG